MRSSTLTLLVLTPLTLGARFDTPLRRRSLSSTPADAGSAPSYNHTRARAERDQAVKQSRYFPELLAGSKKKRATGYAYMVDVDADT